MKKNEEKGEQKKEERKRRSRGQRRTIDREEKIKEGGGDIEGEGGGGVGTGEENDEKTIKRNIKSSVCSLHLSFLRDKHVKIICYFIDISADRQIIIDYQ